MEKSRIYRHKSSMFTVEVTKVTEDRVIARYTDVSYKHKLKYYKKYFKKNFEKVTK